MKNLIIFLIFCISIFIVNIIFYYSSDDYKTFLKDIKGGNEKEVIVETPDFTVDTTTVVDTNNENETIRENEITEASTSEQGVYIDENDLEIIETSKKQNETLFTPVDQQSSLRGEIVLGKNYQDILDTLNKYGLEALEINTVLFDITNEYPDKFLEYYSKDLTLYFFPTKNYREIYNIFDVLSNELPISLNEKTVIGDTSFFINLEPRIQDGLVRMVVAKNGIVFGMKFRKSEYQYIRALFN